MSDSILVYTDKLGSPSKELFMECAALWEDICSQKKAMDEWMDMYREANNEISNLRNRFGTLIRALEEWDPGVKQLFNEVVVKGRVIQ